MRKITVAVLSLLMLALGGVAVFVWQSIPTEVVAETPKGPRTIAKRAELGVQEKATIDLFQTDVGATDEAAFIRFCCRLKGLCFGWLAIGCVCGGSMRHCSDCLVCVGV